MTMAMMSAWLDEMGAPPWDYIVAHWSSEFLRWKVGGYMALMKQKTKAQQEASRGR